MHQADLDQSGRTENLNEPSALALANDTHASILIPAREKRAVYAYLKGAHAKPTRPALRHLRVFTAAVFVLIKGHLSQNLILTIDREFDGRAADLKGMLLQHIWRSMPKYPAANLIVASIGKRSPAHALAYGVYKKRTPPDRVVKAKDLLPYL